MVKGTTIHGEVKITQRLAREILDDLDLLQTILKQSPTPEQNIRLIDKRIERLKLQLKLSRRNHADRIEISGD